MTNARRVGPLLMIVLGLALLFVPSPTSATLVGGIQPCTVDGAPTLTKAVPIQCCGRPPTKGIIIPCPTITLDTTTTSTTTTTEPSTTEPPVTDTTMAPTTPAPTTAPPVVNSGGTVRPRVLARTGTSSSLPMTVAGVSLLVVGAGLAVAGRRRTLASR
jgi:LPXTG-motif cell wall-anchored protein